MNFLSQGTAFYGILGQGKSISNAVEIFFLNGIGVLVHKETPIGFVCFEYKLSGVVGGVAGDEVM